MNALLAILFTVVTLAYLAGCYALSRRSGEDAMLAVVMGLFLIPVFGIVLGGIGGALQ